MIYGTVHVARLQIHGIAFNVLGACATRVPAMASKQAQYGHFVLIALRNICAAKLNL